MKLGFIGCGNMATAMISGAIQKKIYDPQDIFVYDVSSAACDRAKNDLGINLAKNNRAVAKQCDMLVFAVKPQGCEEPLREICQALRPDQLFVSILAGKSLDWLSQQLGEETPIIRLMPNTPALIGEGMTALTKNSFVTAEMDAHAHELCRAFGQVQEVPERLMDAVIAVSGSSPAYIFMLIEAMSDAAVAEGMPRDQARVFAAQTILGSAKLVLKTGRHPAQLKDEVCSPGGTTIEAVQVLEESGFRAAVMKAMRVCADKARHME